jgi:cytochrome c biogenesis protein ResB
MSGLLSRLWSFLSSRNVAIVLLALVTGMLLLGGVLPDPRYMGDVGIAKLRAEKPVIYFLSERFNPGALARGYFFGFVSVFLIISTTACSIDRFIERRRLRKAPLSEIPVSGFDISIKAGDGRDFVQRFGNALRLRRWSLREAVDGEKVMVLAEKGTVGYWGSIFFHAILVTVLVGLAVYYFTGFYGTFLFTEGQSRFLSEENLERIDKRPILGVSLPRLRFTLEHFYVVYWEDREPVEYTARFLMEDIEKGNRWEQTIRVNEPFRYGGMDFLLTYYSYSPNFMVRKNGRNIFDSYVALSLVGNSEDSFDIVGEGLKVRCIFFPDFREDENGYYTETPLPRNPVFLVNITRKGEPLYKGLVALGQEVSAGEYVIRFNDIRYWMTLNLSKETGIGFFFWSSMFGLLGLLLRFMDPDRRILLRHEGGMISVVSFSRHFEGILKQQTADLVHNLKAEGSRDVEI